MNITITITIDESQQRAIETQLQRSGSSETIPQLVARITQKIIGGWAEQHREEFIAKNRPMLEQLTSDLAVDPNRNTKLAPLGVRFVNGVLEPVPPA